MDIIKPNPKQKVIRQIALQKKKHNGHVTPKKQKKKVSASMILDLYK